jgi:hypothetical protein
MESGKGLNYSSPAGNAKMGSGGFTELTVKDRGSVSEQ